MNGVEGRRPPGCIAVLNGEMSIKGDRNYIGVVNGGCGECGIKLLGMGFAKTPSDSTIRAQNVIFSLLNDGSCKAVGTRDY